MNGEDIVPTSCYCLPRCETSKSREFVISGCCSLNVEKPVLVTFVRPATVSFSCHRLPLWTPADALCLQKKGIYCYLLLMKEARETPCVIVLVQPASVRDWLREVRLIMTLRDCCLHTEERLSPMLRSCCQHSWGVGSPTSYWASLPACLPAWMRSWPFCTHSWQISLYPKDLGLKSIR